MRLALPVLLPALVFATSLNTLPASSDEGMVTLSPEDIGAIFCLSRTGNDEAAITGLLSPDLHSAISDARALNTEWEAANPGEKPPLGDGIPWQAWPDYAAACEVGLATLMKTDAKIEISYAFPEAPDAKFTDTLLLKRLADDMGIERWRIDNVAYATGGDLRAFLAAPL